MGRKPKSAAAAEPAEMPPMKSRSRSRKRKSGMKSRSTTGSTELNARGYRARIRVLRGKSKQTVSGLTKDGLMLNRLGRVVSKKKSAASKKLWKKNGLQTWANAVKRARQ